MNAIIPIPAQRAWKPWLKWSLTFVGFPLAGVAARASVGPIDSFSSAIGGGIAAGAVLGAVQAVGLSGPMSRRLMWVAATAAGVGGGLALGASVVDYKTDVASLVAMGALTGTLVGLGQAAVADMPTARRAAWAIGTPALWALGWLITSQVIVDADRQHAMFGSSGAVVVAALSGLILTLRPTADGSADLFVNSENAAVQS